MSGLNMERVMLNGGLKGRSVGRVLIRVGQLGASTQLVPAFDTQKDAQANPVCVGPLRFGFRGFVLSLELAGRTLKPHKTGT